eukprot:3224027-Alexandrium_andersonii.AAC.1
MSGAPAATDAARVSSQFDGSPGGVPSADVSAVGADRTGSRAQGCNEGLSLIHISEPTRLALI